MRDHELQLARQAQRWIFVIVQGRMMMVFASRPGMQLVLEQAQVLQLEFALGMRLGSDPNSAFVLRLGLQHVLVSVQELPPVFELRLREWFGLGQGF